MTMLVDYRCLECGARTEQWMPSPLPAVSSCPSCGAAARRLWSPIGLTGRAASQPSPSVAQAQPSLCHQYPQIPALCMMTPSAQRRMVAAYAGDHRARDREIERQAAAAVKRPPTMADAISPHHQPISG